MLESEPIESTSKPIESTSEPIESTSNVKHPVSVQPHSVGGGANTTLYGKTFEIKTDMYCKLISIGFTASPLVKKPRKLTDYCLSKQFLDKKITYVSQTGFKYLIQTLHNIKTFRLPDEAYIIEYNTGAKVIKILEKKEQQCEGSVETKLWAGPAFIDEYVEILENMYTVEYGFCVNQFLQKKIQSSDKKFIIFNKIMKKYSIPILFGESDNYVNDLYDWVGIIPNN